MKAGSRAGDEREMFQIAEVKVSESRLKNGEGKRARAVCSH